MDIGDDRPDHLRHALNTIRQYANVGPESKTPFVLRFEIKQPAGK